MLLFARDILDTGATGLGVFSSSQSLGGVLAVLVLASLGDYRRKGRLILAIFLFFGIFLVLFGVSPWYATSIALCALVGAMAAAFYGELTEIKDVLSFDMGGTTAKICFTENGKPSNTKATPQGKRLLEYG